MNFRLLALVQLSISFGVHATTENTTLSWILGNLKAAASELNEIVTEIGRTSYLNGPYTRQEALIRRSNSLCSDEVTFCNNRMPYIKRSLEKLIGASLDTQHIPKIAIAASGGGYRAMLNTLGTLLAAEESDFLDSILYISAVSGSTWALAPWIQSGKSLKEITDFLSQQIQTSFITRTIDYQSASSSLFSKWIFNEPLSLVDAYGILLGQHLLGICDTQSLYLATQAKNALTGSFPLPLYSAIMRNTSYQWMEFSPFEIGSEYLGSFIPSWACGRQFSQGINTRFNGEYPPSLGLGFCLGTWSSAFAILLSDPIPGQNQKNALNDILSSRLCNWNYKVDNAPLCDEEFLQLADAGIFINYDLNALLRRDVDIIIILDATTDFANTAFLMDAETYWKARYTLPQFDYTKVATTVCTVFRDSSSPKVPTIIYMPQLKNPESSIDPTQCIHDYCDIINFTYTKEQAEGITHNARLNFTDSLSIIIEEIKATIEKKKNRP